MSEASDNNGTKSGTTTPISNDRLIWLTGLVIITGTLINLIFVSNLSAVGFFVGGILSLINYFWLKFSLKRIFAETSEGDYRPHYSALRHVARYFALAAVLGIVFLTQILPIASVIFGLVSFVFAIFIEAFIRIFLMLIKREEF